MIESRTPPLCAMVQKCRFCELQKKKLVKAKKWRKLEATKRKAACAVAVPGKPNTQRDGSEWE